jgi:hypothetical protein
MSRGTLGDTWADIVDGLGFVPHPWQQYRADVMYELVECEIGRRLAARVAGTIVGRQAGKTAAAGADVLLRALAPELSDVELLVGHKIGPQTIVFTAQDRNNAFAQWTKHVNLILRSRFASHVAKVTRSHGAESLRFNNGSVYEIVTPSKDGARGRSVDLAIIDEALTHEAWLLDTLAPTMAMRDGATNSFGAQLVIISNAGDESSELLNQQRELGRRAVADGDRRRMWHEYSCADDDDPLDPAVWAATMPTYEQPNGIPHEYLAIQAETIGTEAFAREYLCRTTWSTARHVIAPDVWSELPYAQLESTPVVAVEVDPERVGATVVAAGVVDDVVAVQVLEQRPGLEWVVDYVAACGAAVCVVDNYGPASTLIPALSLRVTVHKAASHDVADAAAGLVDAVTARRVGHSGDQRFQDAVTGLSRRQRGDRWVFDRSRGDISAIVAASLAVWFVDTQSASLEAPSIY